MKAIKISVLPQKTESSNFRIFKSSIFSCRCVPVLLLLLPLFAFSQSTTQWEQVYGGNGTEYGYSVKTCPDSGYIVAGSTASGGITDGYIVRTDDLGLMVWTRTFGGSGIDVFRSIKLLPDSGYILCGYSNSPGGFGGYDGWVVRIDKFGNLLWQRYLGTPDWDFFYDVTPTYDGGFVLAGGTYGLGNGDEDFYLVKINANGIGQWTRVYGGVKTDEARGIVQTRDSMLAVVGFTYSKGDSLGDSWIMQTNQNGDTTWTKTLGLSNVADKAWGVSDHIFNRFIVAGEYDNGNDEDGYIQSIFYNGNNSFFLPVNAGVPGDDNLTSVFMKPNTELIGLGTTQNGGGGQGDMFLFYEHSGFFATTAGTFEEDGGYSVDLAKDGGLVACGYTTGYLGPVPNMYLVKFDTNFASTGVLAIRENAVSSTGSAHVFPNPAVNSLSIAIDYKDAVNGELNLTVFDMEGREVIVNSSWRKNSASNFECEVDVSGLSNGIYQFHVITENGVTTSGKFVVAR